jgi:hypothetical protein
MQAAQEWRRILDLSWRHGLAALPATRPEFAIAAGSSRPELADVGDLDRLAGQARQVLDAAEIGVLYIDGAQHPYADDVLLVDANGLPQFSCSSWSNLAQAARAGQGAVLVISTDSPLTVTFAGTLTSLRRHQVDGEWFESVALTLESVSVEQPSGHPRRKLLSGATYLRYCAAGAGSSADPAS